MVTQGNEVRRRIGVTAQDATVDVALTGRQNLVMIGELSRMSRPDVIVRAGTLLDEFALADAADRVVKGYSGGMRRRLDLAASIVTRPPILFLDEPTTGLDPASCAAMWSVIRDLQTAGVTVLLTTQYLDEADQLADRIVVIDHGRVIAEGTPAELKAQVGRQRLEVRLARPAPSTVDAFDVLAAIIPTAPTVSDDQCTFSLAVDDAPGLASRVVSPTRGDRRRSGRGRAASPVARRRVLPPHRPRGRDGRATMERPHDRRPVTRLRHRHAGGRSNCYRLALDAGWWHDAKVLTRRNLVHVRREPAQLSDVTIQPILFTLLFTQLFGAAMVLPGGGSYTNFAVAGLLIMNLATSAPMGTAVGLGTDMSTGIIDRFRTLAMRRSAIVAGRTFSDLLASVMCAVFGLSPASSSGGGPTAASWGCSPASASPCSSATPWFGSALASASAPRARRRRSPSASSPCSHLRSCRTPSCPRTTCPRGSARSRARNPVSAVAAAVRDLWGNPNPSKLINAWPMQHPVAVALIWSFVILGVCSVVATTLFKRRTAD